MRVPRAVLLAALTIASLASGRVGLAVNCCEIEFPRQRDRRIIGPAADAGATYFGVSRRTPQGALDASFGVDGVSAPVEGLPTTTRFPAIAVLPDDKIVAAGHSSENSVRGLVLVRYNADGSLDTGFGEGGFTIISPIFEGNDRRGPEDLYAIAAIAARPGGGVVVAWDGESGPDEAFNIIRVIAADGTPDASFPAAAFGLGTVEDLAVQADDKVVVARHGMFPEYGVVSRYDTDGSADETFGVNGDVTPDLGPENDVYYALAIQPDGKLVIGGGAGMGVNPVYPELFTDLAILRLLPDGSFDESFGDGGKRITPFVHGEDESDSETIQSLVLQCDGNLLAGNGFQMRYTSSGDIDTTFAPGETTSGVDGISDCPLRDPDPTCTLVEPPVCTCCNIEFARQSDGSIIDLGGPGGVAPGGVAYFSVSRRTPDGALDPSFGVDGVTAPVDGLPEGGPSALAILADDKIVVAGESLDENFAKRLVLVRYDADGSLDTEFGEGGFSVLGPFPGRPWEEGEIARFDVAGIAARPGGGVVLTLAFEPNPDDLFHLVAVIAPGGSIDPTFGPPVLSSGYPRDLAVQPDDKIVVLQDGRITRFDPDGTRDENFGSEGNGTVETDLGPARDVLRALVMQPDGKLVAAGGAGLAVDPSSSDLFTDLAIIRLLPDGTFDDTFGEGGKRITTFGSDFEILQTFVLQCDGKLVARGVAANDGEGDDGDPGRGPFLIRYTSSGDVDTAFGVDGVATCESDRHCIFTPPACESPTTTVTSTTSTTSTTQPGPECPATCDDADACTTDACEGSQCVHTPLGGVAAVLCVCEQAAIAECAGEDVPPFVLGQAERACRVLERLADATSKKQQKILGKAARRWQGAAQLLARPKQSSKVSGECAAALRRFLADAAARAAGVRASVRGHRSP